MKTARLGTASSTNGFYQAMVQSIYNGLVNSLYKLVEFKWPFLNRIYTLFEDLYWNWR